MRPLSISHSTSVLSLQQEIQRSEESRYDHRLHGVLLVAHGLDLSGGRRVARRRSAFGRVLGSSLPTTRTGRIDRGRSIRTAKPVECQTDGRDRPGASEQAERCRNAGELMGWQDSVGMDREGLWGSIESAPMPTTVPSTGLSLAQAPASSGQG